MQYDTDGSGQIEFPEFCNMMSHKMNASDDKEAVRNWRGGVISENIINLTTK